MKTLLFLLLLTTATAQNQFKELCDSAARQTDIELFGTDKPTSLDVLRAINRRVKSDCDCDWMIERFEKYTMQLDSGLITVRDLKMYIDDIKRLMAMKRIVREMSQGRVE